MTNFVLTICLGWAGYARFRKGQVGLGVLWLFTFGMFCIGWLIDIVQAYQEMKSGTNNVSTPQSPNYNMSMQFYNVVSDFHTKVVGVTFKNDNGSDRQTIIKQCREGQDVIFRPTPSKKYPEAVGVFTTDGKQLGFLSAELASDLIHKYPNNPMQVNISDITGGGSKTLGCNLHVQIFAVPQK